METPVEIDVQGMEAPDGLRAEVLRHVAQLEKRFGRITACRVSLKAPSEHHRSGGLFEINIRLALPDGKEVDVSRTPPADERRSDLAFALNDAFKRARRRLQDEVRILQGHLKVHEAPSIGTVVKLDAQAGFGFLQSDDEREIYFHKNSVLHGDFGNLALGTRVSFSEEMGEKGPQASSLRPIGEPGAL
jgi:cold shock CspA family protein/ribosome-associated translation inhibitor RaiA